MTDVLLVITLFVVVAGLVALVRLCDRIVGDETTDAVTVPPPTGDSTAVEVAS